MSKFDNHVILPREDFIELQASAMESPTIPDRIATSVQTTLALGALAGAWVGGAWGTAKALDWLEERRAKRDAEKQNAKHTTK